MKTNQAGIDLILSFEGYHTQCKDGSGDCVAYLDKLASRKHWTPGYNGLWTIGFGSTGYGVAEGLRWSRKQAEARFREHLVEKEKAVTALLPLLKFKVDENQFSAMVSGAYNFGEGNLKKLITQTGGDEDAMAKRWLTFCTNGGIKGLVRRRKAEVALFKTYTDKQVVAASRQMTLTEQAKKLLGGTGLASVMSAPFWTDYKVVLVVLGFASAAAGVCYILNKSNVKSLKAVREGRYKPSKMED